MQCALAVHGIDHRAAFASSLTKRIENAHDDPTLLDDLQTHIRGLPLQASLVVIAKQDELDRLGTELWNQATRLHRHQYAADDQPKDPKSFENRGIPLLRAFSFFLLETAGGQGTKGRQRKSCVRLVKVALKAARVCIEGNELQIATKVLGSAAEYQDVLSKEVEAELKEEEELEEGLRAQYFAMRMTLVSAVAFSKTAHRTDARTGMASRPHGHGRAHVLKVQGAHDSPYLCNSRESCRSTIRDRQGRPSKAQLRGRLSMAGARI